jgi:hypothetical protein
VYTKFGSGDALTVHSVHNGPLKPDWQAHVPLPLMPSRQLPNMHTGQTLQLVPKDPDTQLLQVAPWKLPLQLHAPVPLYPWLHVPPLVLQGHGSSVGPKNPAGYFVSVKVESALGLTT